METLTDNNLVQDTAIPGHPIVEVMGFSAIESLTDASKATGWDIEYRQIEAGTLFSEIRDRQVGNVSLIMESANRRLEIAATSPKDAYTIMFSGSTAHVKVNGHLLNKDKVLVIRPGAEIYALSQAHAKVFSIHIGSEIFETTANSLLPGETFLTSGNLLNLGFCQETDQLRSLVTDILGSSPASMLNVHDEVTIIEAIFRAINVDIPLLNRDIKYSQLHRERTLKRLVDFIESNIRINITMAQLCEIGGISQSSLQRIFQRELGMTPYNYVTARRLELARRQLLSVESENLIADIAANAGFNHMGRFAALYRNYYGELPSESRNHS